ncbi:BON domain-containing protein [Herbaspirillum sp. RTI4]|uniref:BON domain-containing protein n=1 Tax=Herbaspirillum sp. RTI4 TaxID=3048640 RepID=UPI002AB42BFF|nr:BON domain-containing protein [Herbaspirillum sp. RTI4]MDY7578660.1 BON domain-containing protein [Herbaspirillum sp. RTI4]MEA9980642.1 BON domain-containing protein [Herbaspirillum sp. RTI4]
MISDSDLQQKVTEELHWEPSIDATHIGVAAKNGIVTLTGYVTRYIEKRNAERAAERVADVKAVVDDIELKIPGASQRNDLDIAESSLTALKLNALIPRERIKLAVENGWITLDGEVDWQYQRIAVEDALKFMLGVKGITNKIMVKPVALISDIQTKIRNALIRNAQIDASQITVETSGNKAILGGKVRSWAERQQAETAAWSAPGISNIENNIHVNF